jgi:hypothetical protein
MEWFESREFKLIAVLIFGVAAVFIAFYQAIFRFNDGPFVATIAECPSTEPKQVFGIGTGFHLRVHAPDTPELSPIVSLVSDHNILWFIHADAYPNTDVKEIEFKSYLWWPVFRYRVTGVVNWTYGEEVTWWFIRGDGKLEEYWYSW